MFVCWALSKVGGILGRGTASRRTEGTVINGKADCGKEWLPNSYSVLESNASIVKAIHCSPSSRRGKEVPVR